MLKYERLQVKQQRSDGVYAGPEGLRLAGLAQEVVLPGCAVLPQTRVLASTVFPVVEWDMTVLAQRERASSSAPVLYRRVLEDRLKQGRDLGSPVKVRAFMLVGPLSRSMMRRVGPLTGWHRGILVTPEPENEIDPLLLAECDYTGLTVACVNEDNEVSVLVRGREAGISEGRTELADMYWLLQEQMFDVALRTGQTPKIGKG